MDQFTEVEIAGFYERAGKSANTDSGMRMTDAFIQPWQLANKTPEEQTKIRQETMAEILVGKQHFNRMRMMMAAWNDGGNMNFPDGVLDWINNFAEKNRTDKFENGQWMTLSTVFTGVGEEAHMRGEDMVLMESRTMIEDPQRSGWVHTHGQVDYLFSDTDIKKTIFDPQINFAFLGLTNGERWMLVRNESPVDFARRYQEKRDEIDDLLKKMGDEQMKIHKASGGVEKHNEVTLSWMQKICPLAGVDLWRIPSGQNTGIKMV